MKESGHSVFYLSTQSQPGALEWLSAFRAGPYIHRHSLLQEQSGTNDQSVREIVIFLLPLIYYLYPN